MEVSRSEGLVQPRLQKIFGLQVEVKEILLHYPMDVVVTVARLEIDEKRV